jgi:type II secretory pathway pseudopilin PulG
MLVQRAVRIRETRDFRGERGFALVTAIMLMSAMLGLGLALVGFADVQQRASGRQQATEQAFDLAEAALNAQVGVLSAQWPATSEQPYPERCTPSTSAGTYGCPEPARLTAGYPNAGSPTCNGESKSEPWGSPYSNGWTTYVRDDVGESALFNSTAEAGAGTARYDLNGNEKMWVRAVGVVRCVEVAIVSLVSRQQIALNFPKAVASGNWFRVTNSGKKVIVSTQGEHGEPNAPVSMRCEERPEPTCKEWSAEKEQISPDTTHSPPTPSPLLTQEQIEAMKSQAQAEGHFYSGAAGSCPKTAEEASGMPAYIEGCGRLKWTTGVGNAAGKPGFLVLANGSLQMEGNSEFHGTIYARNVEPEITGAVVSLGGTAQVFGSIDVDGRGGIELGSSKVNLVWEPRAILNLKVYAGATSTRNSFRILPADQ